MSNWTHPICEECWRKREPHREPHRLVDPEGERCGFCGMSTSSGIYVREDPALVPFKDEKRI